MLENERPEKFRQQPQLDRDAKSASIMIFLRSYRSTTAPAIGLTRITGANVKKPTNAKAVACPVISHAHIVKAKPVMLVPKSEKT